MILWTVSRSYFAGVVLDDGEKKEEGREVPRSLRRWAVFSGPLWY